MAELTPYERARLEQIAQNRAVLDGLGLLGQPTAPPPSASATRQPASASRKPSRVTKRSPEELGIEVRRSSRVRRAPAETPAAEDRRGAEKQRATADKPTSQASPSQPRVASEAGLLADDTDQGMAQPGSSRAVSANLDALEQLGIGGEIPGPPTKASVMEFASRASCPKFSKYAGAIEWKNAIFLFVNVGGSDYKNLFMDGARRMSWFAGGRQHEETPVIKRLLSAKSPRRLLFCRLVQSGAPPSPYVFCGRLEYVRHYPGTLPLEVEWSLGDYDALSSSERFQALMAHASSSK